MKVEVVIDSSLTPDEIVIRCNKNENEIAAITRSLQNYHKSKNIILYKDNEEYFLDVNLILFFETDGAQIFAHTSKEAYTVKQKLYELENLLPPNFMRVSKSTIINIKHIYAINKNITSASLLKFNNTYKQVYVSRLYIKLVYEKMKERRNFI